MSHTSPRPWTPEEFEAQLRDKGAAYHIHHPFNVLLNTGGARPEQIRGWVANRFYYQVCIPRKDAAILANMPDRAHRRLWVDRILDHDGSGDYEGSQAGGIEASAALKTLYGRVDREIKRLADVDDDDRAVADSEGSRHLGGEVDVAW